MKLLHVDSSIQGQASASRAISAEIVERLRSQNPELEVTYRDLAASPLPHLTMDVLAGVQTGDVLPEFLSADIVVIGAAMYNFTIPSQLKAWFDQIIAVGQTFRYGADGRPQGLAGAKRVIIALARGGIYSGGSPSAHFEHGETLLRILLGFIGINNPEFIIAEGLVYGPDARKASIEAAIVKARELSNLPALF